MKPIKNPFSFGNPVEGDYYLPRPDLEKTVSNFLENKIPVILIGPRRFGKTSFLLNLLYKNQNSHPFLFIDIFNITSHKDFLLQLVRALHKKRTLWDKAKNAIKSISRARPKVTTQFDSQTHQPTFDFSLDFSNADERDIKESIQDLLSSLSKLGKGLILAIDEFQKISEINDEGWLEATIRTQMQELRNTSFIFTGSRRTVIYEMLNNHKRPLYKFCQPIEFPALGNDFTDWIVKRFKTVGIDCQSEAIEHLRDKVQNSPNYVQMICFHLVTLGKDKIGKKEIDEVLITVVKQNAYAYQTLLNSLTATQQRTLRLAAIEEKNVFTKELLTKYEITSGAALSSAIKSLKEKEILDEEGSSKGSVVFDDPLFALWLKTSFSDSNYNN